MNVYRSSDPATDPLTSALVEEKMSFQSGFDSNIVTSLIKESTTQLEYDTGVSLISQEWTMTLNNWPQKEIIHVPHGPVMTIDSFTYIDGAGATQTLVEDTDFRVSTVGQSTVLTPISDWPVNVADSDDYSDAIIIVYTSGHSSVPEWAKGAIYLLIVMDYNNGQVDTLDAYHRKIRRHRDKRDYRVLNR